jgi:hypothetical protein
MNSQVNFTASSSDWMRNAEAGQNNFGGVKDGGGVTFQG